MVVIFLLQCSAVPRRPCKGPEEWFFFQYIKQHIIPLEEVKLESLEDDGRKFF
jgi:hypothetical protein